MKIIIQYTDEIDIDGKQCGAKCKYFKEKSFHRDTSWNAEYWYVCENPFWGRKLKYWESSFGDNPAGTTCLGGGGIGYRCKKCLNATIVTDNISISLVEVSP